MKLKDVLFSSVEDRITAAMVAAGNAAKIGPQSETAAIRKMAEDPLEVASTMTGTMGGVLELCTVIEELEGRIATLEAKLGLTGDEHVH